MWHVKQYGGARYDKFYVVEMVGTYYSQNFFSKKGQTGRTRNNLKIVPLTSGKIQKTIHAISFVNTYHDTLKKNAT